MGGRAAGRAGRVDPRPDAASQFDPGRGSARNWLLAIVADQARKQHRRSPRHLELVDEHGAGADSGIDVDLRRALVRLTHRQRTAVLLHHYLGLPLADVAEVLDCAVGTVKSTLSDARARLRAAGLSFAPAP